MKDREIHVDSKVKGTAERWIKINKFDVHGGFE